MRQALSVMRGVMLRCSRDGEVPTDGYRCGVSDLEGSAHIGALIEIGGFVV
jgi:hypothetical protein